MEFLVWIGTAIALAGLAGLVWCIIAVARARRANLDESEMPVRLRQVVAVNMAAFLTSVLGLIVVVVGMILG
jgi:hypothetical protein